MWHRTSTVIIVYGITTICTNVVPMNLLHVYSQQLSYHCSNNLSWTTPPRLFQNIHSQPPDKSPLCRLMRTFLKQWTWICFNCFLDNAVNNCAAAWCYNNDHKSAQLEELVLLLIVPCYGFWHMAHVPTGAMPDQHLKNYTDFLFVFAPSSRSLSWCSWLTHTNQCLAYIIEAVTLQMLFLSDSVSEWSI